MSQELLRKVIADDRFLQLKDQPDKQWEMAKKAWPEIEGIVKNQQDVDSFLQRANNVTIGSATKEEQDTASLRPPPTAMDTIKEEAPAVGGAVAGGLAAGIPGAALGAMGGRGYQQVGRALMGKKTPETELKMLQDLALKGGREAALEAGGRGVFWGLKGVTGPLSHRVTPEERLAWKFLKPEMKANVGKYPDLKGRPPYLPSEVTENRLLDIVQNVSEYSIAGGGKIKDFKRARGDLFEKLADDLVDSVGKDISADEVGELAVRSIEGGFDALKIAVEPLYRQMNDLAPDATIQSLPLKRMALEHLRLAKKAGGVAGKHAGDEVSKDIMKVADELTLTEARELRSRLIDASKAIALENKKAKAIGKVKTYTGEIDNLISKELSENYPEAHDLWRHANQLWKRGKGTFDNKFISSLVRKADPELVGGTQEAEALVNQVFKKKGVSRIRMTKRAVDGNTWQQLKSYYIRDLLSRSTPVKGAKAGSLQGDELMANMFGRSGMGERALSEIFSESELNSIRGFANALKVSQQQQGEGTGKMLIQLSQAGAMGGVAGSMLLPDQYGEPLQATSVGIIVAPMALSRMLLRPSISRHLSLGLVNIKPKTAGAFGLAARMSNMVWQVEQAHRNYLQGVAPPPVVTPPKAKGMSRKIKPLSPKTPAEKLRTIKLPSKPKQEPKPKPKQETKPKQTSQAPKKPRQTSTKTDQTPPSQRGGAHHKKTRFMEKTATIGNVTKNDTQVGNYSLRGPVTVEETLRKLLR